MTSSATDKLHYVLDTNVLLHDPMALFRFKEHNIHLPLAVLEELDKHKKGLTDVARNARQVTRQLGALVANAKNLQDGFNMTDASNGAATGTLFFQSHGGQTKENPSPTLGLDTSKMDNQILIQTAALRTKYGDSVILVTKDINLRVKALALGLRAEDYLSGKVLSDEDVLPTGYQYLPANYWEMRSDTICVRKNNKTSMLVEDKFPINSFLVDDSIEDKTTIWRVGPDPSNKGSMLQAIVADEKGHILKPRNVGQRIANNLLFDDTVDLVALLGKAGSGKTLLALAAGLQQVKAKRYDKIIITRATVPMGEDIGFLPGTEEEKMNAWLGGVVDDCFTALKIGENDPLRKAIEPRSMTFMRGRSFHRLFVIIDEAQNLTKLQMRGLITRAGEGSKVVVTGNISQIDSPYIDESSSGLAWAVKKFKNWEHAGHIILPEGVRSRLATHAESLD